jgi:hypothetical protein
MRGGSRSTWRSCRSCCTRTNAFRAYLRPQRCSCASTSLATSLLTSAAHALGSRQISVPVNRCGRRPAKVTPRSCLLSRANCSLSVACQSGALHSESSSGHVVFGVGRKESGLCRRLIFCYQYSGQRRPPCTSPRIRNHPSESGRPSLLRTRRGGLQLTWRSWRIGPAKMRASPKPVMA